MTEGELKRKLTAVEALLQGATTAGERDAAATVLERLKARCAEQAVDHQFTVQDPWARRLFIAMLRRAGLEPFRQKGQRRTTLMVHGRRSVVVGVVWREFMELQPTLAAFLAEVTARVIEDALGEAGDEAEERAGLPAA